MESKTLSLCELVLAPVSSEKAEKIIAGLGKRGISRESVMANPDILCDVAVAAPSKSKPSKTVGINSLEGRLRRHGLRVITETKLSK